MNPLLLDTCAVIWLASKDLSRFSASAIDRMRSTDTIFMSPITAWEISLKYAKGVLELPMSPREMVDEFVRINAISILPLSVEIMHRAAELEMHHKDPADRFIIASALTGNLTVITGDSRFAQYGVSVIQ